MNCICCGKETADYPYRVLQVQTLHVRGLQRESRVQALGDFENYCVCGDCAEKRLLDDTQNSKAFQKNLLLFGLLAAAGLIVTAYFLKGNGALRLLGLGMLACGLLGIYSDVQDRKKRQAQLRGKSQKEALADCAWAVLTDCAPKKNDINDIRYIPVTEETLRRKNGDLMILYDLLPQIAIEAHKKLHEAES